MHKNMKKARVSYFSCFLHKIAQKWQFFSFSVVNFFSYAPSLSVTYFFTVMDCFIRFKMFDYAQKYKKGSFFLFFLIFCQKLPKNGNFFYFLWSIFFSYTPPLSVTYFFTVVDCFIRFKMFDYAQIYKKGSFFLFFLIFCQKL